MRRHASGGFARPYNCDRAQREIAVLFSNELQSQGYGNRKDYDAAVYGKSTVKPQTKTQVSGKGCGHKAATVAEGSRFVSFLVDFTRVNTPNFRRVFTYSAVGRELAGTGHIQDRLTDPSAAIPVRGVHTVLCLDVVPEIG